MSASAKTLVMFIVSVVAGIISESGIPQNKVALIIFLSTVLGATVTYVAKNVVFPSVSVFGVIDLRDFLSAFFLGLGTAISNWIGTLVANVPIDWSSLATAVLSVMLGYFLKNFASGERLQTK